MFSSWGRSRRRHCAPFETSVQVHRSHTPQRHLPETTHVAPADCQPLVQRHSITNVTSYRDEVTNKWSYTATPIYAITERTWETLPSPCRTKSNGRQLCDPADKHGKGREVPLHYVFIFRTP